MPATATGSWVMPESVRTMTDTRRTRLAAWIGGAAVLLLPVIAMAAEAAEGGEAHGEPSIFAGDWMNALWTLIIFVVLLTVLGKFAWRPILATLQRREQFIRESLEEAARSRDEAEKRLAEYEDRIRKAHEEALAVVDEGRRNAEDLKRRLMEQGRAEADAMSARAKREIQLAKDTAVKQLYDLVADMTTDVAAKVLQRHLGEEEHRRLVESSLEEIRRLADSGGRN